MPKSLKLAIHEDFARFLEAPSRERLREMLRSRTGEYDFIDFKEAWPEPASLAKHVLAFANSGHGCLVVGVAELADGSLETRGIATIADKTQLKNSIAKYLPTSVEFEIHDFAYLDSEYVSLKGKSFQVLFVECDPNSIPVLSLAETTNLFRNRIYVRSNNSTTEADHSTVQSLIERRINASLPSKPLRNLKLHLEQLSALYEFTLPEEVFEFVVGEHDKRKAFYEFIHKMIGQKQAIIRDLVNHPGEAGCVMDEQEGES